MLGENLQNSRFATETGIRCKSVAIPVIHQLNKPVIARSAREGGFILDGPGAAHYHILHVL